jgi:RNA polymerase sigma-70 factor (ECF subfamily)
VRTATVIDHTDDLFHLNLPQNSGFETPDGSVSVIEITAVINSFSDEYRIPFSMHVEGYKYAEIADEMQLPLGTVKSRIFFARQRLQKMLYGYQS